MKSNKYTSTFTYANSIYSGLKFTTKSINSNFKIKVSGIDSLGRKLNKLVGVAGLIALIGMELVNKFVARAFKGIYNGEKITCKLRRGLVVTFYNY